MAQTGFTPIVTYNTATATTVPSAANLAQGELAVNVTDKKLYTKDSGGNVVLLASNGGDVTGPASSTNLAIPTFSGTGGKTLLNNSGVTITAGVITATGFSGPLTGNASTVTTNANLTGPITSVGNATSIASQTGTGTTFAMSASPTFTGTVGAADLTTTGNTILGDASTDTLNVASGTLVTDGLGKVGIGTATPLAKLEIRGTPDANWGNTVLFDNRSVAINQGGMIAFGGYKTGTSAQATFAQIQGAKENATSGNEAGYLSFSTNNNTTYVERMRIFSSGGVSIGNTTDPGATNLSVTGSNYVGVARYAPPQVTASVSTVTDIFTPVASINICWVLGTSGANYFLDLISARAGGEVVVLQSNTLLGSPAARTYSLPAAYARLSMASGTYRVTVTPLGIPVS